MSTAELSRDRTPEHHILQQAAEWYVLLSSDGATAADRSRWQSWMQSRDDHRRAWQYVESVSRRFSLLQVSDDKQAAVAALQAPQGALSRRRMLGMLAVVSAGGLLGLGVMRDAGVSRLLASLRADYRTGIGEMRDITLTDGTRVWLNTDTALDVEYDDRLRQLHLHRGEILIETGRDVSRPFQVETAYGRLVALGTRFTVRLTDQAATLAVYDGAVELHSFASEERRLVINVGQQVNFDRNAIHQRTSADPAREAWARGVLLAENVPLGDFIAELSRYQRGYIGCDPDVAALRVMGAYPLREPERVLAMLENVLPVSVNRHMPWWVSIDPRSADR